MSTAFPGSLDVFVNPAAADSMNSPAVYHDVQHANINDAVTALQAKIGIDGSAVTTSLDYLIKAAWNPGHGHSGFTLPTGGDFSLVFTGTPVTVDGTNYHFGLGVVRSDVSIAAGITDSGARWGTRMEVYTDTGLVGTLAALYALQFSYGNYVGATGTIVDCYGVHINPFCFAGTITNLYGIYIREPYTGGTLTNEWGIYQVSTTAKNFFGGITTFASGAAFEGPCTLVFTDSPVAVNQANYRMALDVLNDDIPISSGVIDSGARWGVRITTHANAGLVGTLAALYGLQISCGNYTSVPVTGTITNCYGIHVNAHTFAGVITNLYGIYIREPYAGGTITNEWGIYQVSTTAQNFFGGTVRAGGYKSSDGSAGISGIKTLLVSVTIKNGLITAWS